MFRNLCLWLTLLITPTQTSCSIAEPAKQAAKEWWQENGRSVWMDLIVAAQNYWTANESKIIGKVLEAAEKLALKSKEEAIAYIDIKLGEQREAVVTALVKSGSTREEIDTNLDGSITDEELQAYMLAKPSKLWSAGGVAAAWWLLWRARKKWVKKDPAAPADPVD